MHFQACPGMADREGFVHLGDQARAEPHHRHGGVLQPDFAHAGALLLGHDVDGFVVEHKAQGVGIMDRDVENDASAGRRIPDPPALEMTRQVNGMEDACRDRLADLTSLDGVPHRPVARGVPQVMVGAHHHTGGGACLDHGAGVGDAESQRLLAQDVLAGLGRRKGLGKVQLVGRRDIDGIHRRIGQKLFHAVITARNAVLPGEGGAAFGTAAHHRDNFRIVLSANGADHPLLGDRAGADQSPPYFLGHDVVLLMDLPGAPQEARTTS
jgi:hypothetical protein